MSVLINAPRPIRKVLVANRGEIACRIFDTCRRLGLRTVAVHSDADAHSRHVRMADEAVQIGGAAAGRSYLNIASVIEAATATGADAVHPGYGFLSENADFVRACEEAGLIFVGPSAQAVESMGSKIEARRIAAQSGVPVVPGFDGRDASDADLASAASDIGYPVLVKASAGGGGRGMRRVDRAEDLGAALQAARSEALAAFGDGTVYIEKYIASPRHLEVQIFGDGEGGVLHLHERDCSAQRNHQKFIEEAPAPNLGDDVRATLFEDAIRLASAIRYSGAGTVEFIMPAGGDRPFFLEMNTRLQVEHPVTEAVCGIDLVEWQLRQAAGLALPLTQDGIRTRGHAIEARLNAERPGDSFLPSTGRILDVVAPAGLRFDTGIEPGSDVGTHYDSMLAKLIAHGPDRETARVRLVEGLRTLAIPGVTTNQAFLADCLERADFVQGVHTTAFLSENFADGWKPDRNTLLRLRGQAALASLGDGETPLTRIDGFRIAGRRHPARIPLRTEDAFGTSDITLILGNPTGVSDGEVTVELGAPAEWMRHENGRIQIADDGIYLSMTARPLAEVRLEERDEGRTEGRITAPLTGLVTQVNVAPGDTVGRGETLVVMEAMKLVHALNAPFAGLVRSVACREGDTLNARSLLVEMEETG